MMSISTSPTSSLRSSVSMPSRPFSAYRTSAPYLSKTLVSANTFRTSSSTISIFEPFSGSCGSGACRDAGRPAAPWLLRPLRALGARRFAAGRGKRGPGGKVEGERAAVTWTARGLDLPAEQPGDVPADRKAEPGAAVTPAGGPVGLLEGLEDEALLVLGDADPGVGDGERDHFALVPQRAGERDVLGGRDAQPHASLGGELHGVGQQIAQDLLEPLLVTVELGRQAGRGLDLE